jgi:hypothetical protein
LWFGVVSKTNDARCEIAISAISRNLVAKEKAAEEKTTAEAKRMAKVSISIQFNAMSSFLPPSYGIGEAGGGGHCGPNSLAYIIFGDVAGGPIIRKVLTCIMSDDFLLACSLKFLLFS